MIEVQLPPEPPALNDRAARTLLELLTRAQARRAEANDQTPGREQAA